MVGGGRNLVNRTHRICTTFRRTATRLASGRPQAESRIRTPLPRFAIVRLPATVAALALLLSACADEGGPSFAPEAATETAVRALTPIATSTPETIDRQPEEDDVEGRTLADLSTARGATSAVVTRDGGALTVYDAATGAALAVQLAEPSTLAGAVASPDGTVIAVLRRVGDRLILERVDDTGTPLSSLDLTASRVGSPVAANEATPVATGVASPAASAPVTRDRLEIAPDGRHVVVVSQDGDLHIVAVEGQLTVVRLIEDFGDVSTLGWTGDGALALVGTYDQSRSTGNLTGVPLEGRLRSILRLPAGDARRIVYVASPGASQDVYYVLRSVTGDWTAQNNLYRIPIVGGTPSALLGSSLAGPAGAVDRFAVSDDGRTVAAVVMIPRGDDLTFHSLWVTEVDTSRPLEVDTGSLGLVSRLVWSGDGLFVVGVQRARDTSSSRLVTATLRLDSDGALVELSRSESAATPAASPIASSVAATPAASPVG